MSGDGDDVREVRRRAVAALQGFSDDLPGAVASLPPAGVSLVLLCSYVPGLLRMLARAGVRQPRVVVVPDADPGLIAVEVRGNRPAEERAKGEARTVSLEAAAPDRVAMHLRDERGGVRRIEFEVVGLEASAELVAWADARLDEIVVFMRDGALKPRGV